MRAIKATSLSKMYRIYPTPAHRLKEKLSLGRKKHYREFWALRDIEFAVERGETLGIIGANGAGKSTLLKMITGTSPLTKGEITVQGRVSALLELGAGFHPELTGRENLFLNASLLGLEQEEIEDRADEIIDFAELRDYIDMPVTTYSSGMYMRLGFAVASSVRPDVLIIDEVLAVGDQYFQRKCIERLKELRDSDTTILFVSHNLGVVKNLCSRAIWLHKGLIEAAGDTEAVVDRYMDWTRDREGEYVERHETRMANARAEVETVERVIDTVEQKWGSGEAKIEKVRLLDSNGNESGTFKTGSDMTVEVRFNVSKPLIDPTLGVSIHRNDGVYCFGPNTRVSKASQGNFSGEALFRIKFRKLPLLHGSYAVSAAVYDRDIVIPYDFHNRLYTFQVVSESREEGIFHIDHEWEVVRGKVE